MITQDEINNLGVGIYRFYWKSGGSSILALGVTRDGNRWIAPLNWSYPSDITAINDGQVVSYIKLLDKKGEQPDNFEKIDALLNRSQDLILKIQQESHKNKLRIKRQLFNTVLLYSILGLLCIASLAFVFL